MRLSKLPSHNSLTSNGAGCQCALLYTNVYFIYTADTVLESSFILSNYLPIYISVHVVRKIYSCC